jgi:hypothetical protein
MQALRVQACYKSRNIKVLTITKSLEQINVLGFSISLTLADPNHAGKTGYT